MQNYFYGLLSIVSVYILINKNFNQINQHFKNSSLPYNLHFTIKKRYAHLKTCLYR